MPRSRSRSRFLGLNDDIDRSGVGKAMMGYSDYAFLTVKTNPIPFLIYNKWKFMKMALFESLRCYT